MAEHEHDDLPHDHDTPDDEIEITIEPREEDLQALGVAPEEFEAALMTTLDGYDKAIDVDDPDATAPLEEAEITLKGKAYRLGEVADIAITGGFEGLGGEDDDDQEGEADLD